MRSGSKDKLISLGVRAADSELYDEDSIWASHSGDKPDSGRMMLKAIRPLLKELPLSKRPMALSIGSGAEPQLQILSSIFQGGVNLLDIDEVPLEAVREKCKRLHIKHVTTIKEDFNSVLLSDSASHDFQIRELNGNRQSLITLHHSLYYSKEKHWFEMFRNMEKHLLARTGVIHAVLMNPRSKEKNCTTWLYNHFAGKFMDSTKDQDLKALTETLQSSPEFKNCVVEHRTSKVDFFVNDFGKLMAVVWMILLYPDVHDYTISQREEITEYIHDNLWIREEPLVQHQDHLIISRGLGENAFQ